MNFLRAIGIAGLSLLAVCDQIRAQSQNFTLQLPLSLAIAPDTIRNGQAVLASRPANSFALFSNPILPAGAATAHYGFFCRQELKWDKKLLTQLRFRVGSYEACDRLEGKRRD